MADSLLSSGLAWYCLRAQPKHEHIAAAHLRQLEIPEVFSPRIRFRKVTQQGVKTVTESLFPNYLFARFDPEPMQVKVRYARGVAGILHFGEKLATVPDAVMADLRSRFQDQEMLELPDAPKAGDVIRLTAEPFRGLEAVVTQVLPARERVRVLLDFLGRTSEVEVRVRDLIRPKPYPSVLLD